MTDAVPVPSHMTQLALVLGLVIFIGKLVAIHAVPEPVQVFTSVTVTEYEPAHNPVAVGVVWLPASGSHR